MAARVAPRVKMVACDYDIETYNFGVHGVLEQALRVVLLLCRPIPKPKRGHQLDAPYKHASTMAYHCLKALSGINHLGFSSASARYLFRKVDTTLRRSNLTEATVCSKMLVSSCDIRQSVEPALSATFSDVLAPGMATTPSLLINQFNAT